MRKVSGASSRPRCGPDPSPAGEHPQRQALDPVGLPGLRLPNSSPIMSSHVVQAIPPSLVSSRPVLGQSFLTTVVQGGGSSRRSLSKLRCSVRFLKHNAVLVRRRAAIHLLEDVAVGDTFPHPAVCLFVWFPLRCER